MAEVVAVVGAAAAVAMAPQAVAVVQADLVALRQARALRVADAAVTARAVAVVQADLAVRADLEALRQRQALRVADVAATAQAVVDRVAVPRRHLQVPE